MQNVDVANTVLKNLSLMDSCMEEEDWHGSGLLRPQDPPTNYVNRAQANIVASFSALDKSGVVLSVRVDVMAKANGKLSTKAVEQWFTAMGFDEQKDVLDSLSGAHSRVRDDKIRLLREELATLENGSGMISTRKNNGKSASKGTSTTKGRPKVAVKYRDAKSGETWSGRGRMAGWLAAKVKAGEKADKYLV